MPVFLSSGNHICCDEIARGLHPKGVNMVIPHEDKAGIDKDPTVQGY